MVASVTLDKAGRIVLPKPLRDDLQFLAGDRLEAETCGEQITLPPVRAHPPLRKKRGVWVYRTGEPRSSAAVQETLRQVRRERSEQNLGKSC